MTAHGRGQGEPTADERLDELVATFWFHREEDPGFDLDAFCAQQPEALRAELAERCRVGHSLRRLLQGGRAEREAAPDRRQQLGPYRLEKQIGRGAMAEVYLAVDERTGERRALKVLRGSAGAAASRSEARFRREAQTLGKLHHPAIVTVHEIGEAGGRLYIAMDYVAGRTLGALIADERRARSGGELSDDATVDGIDVNRVARLVATLAGALHAAHQHDVIHRDLKPDNVLVDDQGQPHLLDFGLARDQAEASISAEGDLAGTPYYMSPEQVLGERAELGPTTDVFSLGVLLYELLTLRRPFRGKDLGAVLGVIAEAVVQPPSQLNPSLPRDLEAICLRALQREPENRYPTAQALADDLAAFAEHRAVSAALPVVSAPAPARAGRGRALAVVAVLAVGLTLLADWLAASWTVTRAVEALPSVAATASLSTDRLLEAAAEVRRLTALGVQPLGTESSHLQALRAALAVRARLELDGVRRALRSADAGVALRAGGGHDDLAADSHRLLLIAALLSPDQVSSLLEPSAWFPRLSVAGDPPGDAVSLRPLDPADLSPLGPWTPRGSTPLSDVALEPGAWQVLVLRDGRGQAEFVRLLDRPMQHTLLNARPTPVAEDMLVFDGGSERGQPASSQPAAVQPAFRIDPRPVSRARFAAFLRGSGAQERLARFGAADPGTPAGEAPVTGVDFAAARACAEWFGKRLPSAVEWERAARAGGFDMPLSWEWTATPELLPVGGNGDTAGDGERSRVDTSRRLVRAGSRGPGPAPGPAQVRHVDDAGADLGFRLAASVQP